MTDDGSSDHGADDKDISTDDLSVDQKLNLETGVIAWKDLLPHFARGVVIRVLEGRDLIEVGEVLARDDTNQLQKWLADSSVARASDDDARDWTTREPEFWCVVMAPWVLVQEYSKKSTLH